MAEEQQIERWRAEYADKSNDELIRIRARSNTFSPQYIAANEILNERGIRDGKTVICQNSWILGVAIATLIATVGFGLWTMFHDKTQSETPSPSMSLLAQTNQPPATNSQSASTNH
jgi:hypothetical protein